MREVKNKISGSQQVSLALKGHFQSALQNVDNVIIHPSFPTESDSSGSGSGLDTAAVDLEETAAGKIRNVLNIAVVVLHGTTSA